MFKIFIILKNYITRYKFNKKSVIVGKNTKILCNYLNFGSEPYLVEIGDNCTITSGVKFLTHDDSISVCFNKFKVSRCVEKNIYYEKLGRIKIKNNCFIGINSIIMPGITINSNVIVAAGSVVIKDISEGMIVGGNPAKVIGRVEEYNRKMERIIIKIDQDNRIEDIKKKMR